MLPVIKAILQPAAKNVTTDDTKKIKQACKTKKVEPTYATYKRK